MYTSTSDHQFKAKNCAQYNRDITVLKKKAKANAYWSKEIAVHALSMVITFYPAVTSWNFHILHLVI